MLQLKLCMYLTKQMNLTLMQNEMILNRMTANEKGYAERKQLSENRIETINRRKD